MIRYDRWLTDAAMAQWAASRVPSRLLLPLLHCVPTDLSAFDLQLRERRLGEDGVLQMYHGNTCLLRITSKQGGVGLSICFGSYEQSVAKLLPGLRREWAVGEVSVLGRHLCALLPELVDHVGAAYYRNRKEGFWENRLAYSHGRKWNSEQEWLIVDRQAVIGYSDETERQKLEGPIVRRHLDALAAVDRGEDASWAASKTFGNELDLLAIDRQSSLVCVELKHASNSGGVYYGPFQAAVYGDIYRAAAECIAPGIERMVRQKVELGLLSSEALARLPLSRSFSVRSVLAIAGRPSATVKRRMGLCLASCPGVEIREVPDDADMTAAGG